MNPIGLFFLIAAVLCMLSGYLLPRFVDKLSVKKFGIGLFLFGLGQLFFAFALTNRTVTSLHGWISVGVFCILIGILYFIRSATHHLPPVKRRLALAIMALFGILVWRLWVVFPSDPNFSGGGLFQLNPHPLITFMAVVLITASLAPATLSIFKDIRQKDVLSSNIFYASMIALRAGCILLLGYAEDLLLILDGLTILVSLIFLTITSSGFFASRAFRDFPLFRALDSLYNRIMHYRSDTLPRIPW